MTNKEQFLSNTELIHKLPLFYQPNWLNIVCGDNWDVIFSRDANEKIAGIFIFITEKKLHFTLIRTPKLTPYFGLYLLPNDLTNKKLWDWEEWHINNLISLIPKFSYCQFCTHPSHTNFVNLHFLGFTQRASLTYYIDLLKDEKLLVDNISTRTRRYIKNVDEFYLKEGAEHLNEIINLHKNTFKKQGIKYPYTNQLISQLISSGYNENFGKLYTLFNSQNELVAFLWIVYDAITAYQILSSYDANLAGQDAMTLLTWNAIKDTKNLGLLHYDFEGSILKGVEHFFRKFGGKRKVFYSFEKNNSVLWRLKKMLY